MKEDGFYVIDENGYLTRSNHLSAKSKSWQRYCTIATQLSANPTVTSLVRQERGRTSNGRQARAGQHFPEVQLALPTPVRSVASSDHHRCVKLPLSLMGAEVESIRLLP